MSNLGGFLARAWIIAVLTLLVAAVRAQPPDPLAAQVASASAGAIVNIPAGVHEVNLTLDKPITLVGEPGAILDGGGHGDIIRVASPDVTIRNLELRRSGTNLTAMNAGIFVEKKVRRVTITGNTLRDTLFGIYLDGPADVLIEDNRISGLQHLRVADRGDGIHLWNDTNIQVRNNDIGYVRDGIYIYISPGNRIIGNHMHHLRYGIHYMYSRANVIEGNHADHTEVGYALMQSDHLTVRNNHAEDSENYGMLLNYVTYSELAGNIIRRITGPANDEADPIPGASGKGIFLYNSEFNRLHDNTIENCRIGIHVTAGSEGNEVYDNAFLDNVMQVKYVQNVADEWSKNGRGNYWSGYLGWDLDHDGLGDIAYQPNDGVDILLWKYPSARLLLNSPALLTLRYVQRAFPVFMPPTVRDSHPLMTPPKALPWTNQPPQ